MPEDAAQLRFRGVVEPLSVVVIDRYEIRALKRKGFHLISVGFGETAIKVEQSIVARPPSATRQRCQSVGGPLSERGRKQ
jgi:hypothetical protein